MLVKLKKNAIDLGIVVSDLEASIAFYQGVLGFVDEGEIPFPGGGTMRRLGCGDTTIKLVHLAENPKERAPGGGIEGATGYRYWTISVSNLEEIAKACEEAGCAIPLKPIEVPAAGRFLIVEDPDGNWVEFAEYATA